MSAPQMSASPDLTPRVLDLIFAARRVYQKYGAASDWTEWTDLRDALSAVDAIDTGSTRIERADLIILLLTHGGREEYGKGFDAAQEYFQDYASDKEVR